MRLLSRGYVFFFTPPISIPSTPYPPRVSHFPLPVTLLTRVVAIATRNWADKQLEALGFDRQMVLQAYMLCDKNEELAANFLFDSGDDEMS
jgi:hypothetical protein